MSRPRIYFEEMVARLPAGTFARMDRLREKREKRTDFVRRAVERELRRLEREMGAFGGRVVKKR